MKEKEIAASIKQTRGEGMQLDWHSSFEVDFCASCLAAVSWHMVWADQSEKYMAFPNLLTKILRFISLHLGTDTCWEVQWLYEAISVSLSTKTTSTDILSSETVGEFSPYDGCISGDGEIYELCKHTRKLLYNIKLL